MRYLPRCSLIEWNAELKTAKYCSLPAGPFLEERANATAITGGKGVTWYGYIVSSGKKLSLLKTKYQTLVNLQI